MRLAHIMMTRNSPTPEIRETAVPATEVVERVAHFQRSWDTVFVYRFFFGDERP